MKTRILKMLKRLQEQHVETLMDKKKKLAFGDEYESCPECVQKKLDEIDIELGQTYYDIQYLKKEIAK